jgi:hypothetical protein
MSSPLKSFSLAFDSLMFFIGRKSLMMLFIIDHANALLYILGEACC